LTGDGLSEILMCGRAMALQFNKNVGAFNPSLISQQIRRMSSAAILADITGDGEIDFAFITPADKLGENATLVVLPGHDGGRFEKPPIEGWQGPCAFPTVLTAGDVDGDGDLDLFLAQYKAPNVDGQMPTPAIAARKVLRSSISTTTPSSTSSSRAISRASTSIATTARASSPTSPRRGSTIDTASACRIPRRITISTVRLMFLRSARHRPRRGDSKT
jgi:hypothetical protein